MNLLFSIVLLVLSIQSCADQNSDGDAVPAGTRYYFSIFGDSRDGNAIFSGLQSRSVLAGRPLFTVHVGDMISSPESFGQWPSFIVLTKTFFEQKNFYPVVGNHDVNDAQSLDVFQAAFPKVGGTGYYSKVLADCFCVFLNTEDLETKPGIIGPAQLNWLELELASEPAKAAKFRIVFTHRPAFPQNHHLGHPLEPAETLHELYKKYGIEAVVSGHEHSYSKIEKDGIIYLITGSAGSPLFTAAGPSSAFLHYMQVSVQNELLQFRAIDFFGKVRDDFKINLR